jgi:hypothetical protein
MEVDPFDRHDVPRHDLKRVSVSLIKSLWQLFFAWNKYASLNSTGKPYIPRNRKLEKMTLKFVRSCFTWILFVLLLL